jgi:monoamine oxidase
MGRPTAGSSSRPLDPDGSFDPQAAAIERSAAPAPTAAPQLPVPNHASAPQIAIVGAGLAGLACGYELQQHGLRATLYEASDRLGGRCYSDAALWPTRVIERGGELIDSRHHALLGYARRFGLAVEDMTQQPGQSLFYFRGQAYSRAALMAEYEAFLVSIRTDLQALSARPTAWRHSPTDAQFDQLSLQDYLEQRQAGDLLRAYLNSSYQTEHGLPLAQQTCLNFLLVHRASAMADPTGRDPNLKDLTQNLGPKADPRSRDLLTIASDERYHISGGNGQIVARLGQALADQVKLGQRLVRIRRRANQQLELTFGADRGSPTATIQYDVAIITLPFAVLREVELDPSLEIPDWKRAAIHHLQNGTQAKLMLGFDQRPWQRQGGNGIAISDRAHHQSTWETNPSQVSTLPAVLASLASGQLGSGLDPQRPQAMATALLADLEQLHPGAMAAATRNPQGQLLTTLEQWTTNPYSRGSYTCYQPGQFTQFAGREATAIHNLYFAGEHTNSFYEWQGYMEGAVISGIQAAKQILYRS